MLDDWTIRYELGDDGSVSKFYVNNVFTPADSFVVALDENDEMKFPERNAGKELMLFEGGTVIVGALNFEALRTTFSGAGAPANAIAGNAITLIPLQ